MVSSACDPRQVQRDLGGGDITELGKLAAKRFDWGFEGLQVKSCGYLMRSYPTKGVC